MKTFWVRIIPLVQSDTDEGMGTVTITSELTLEIYPSQTTAEAAAEQYGGIALEVTGASLRGKNDPDDPVTLEREPAQYGQVKKVPPFFGAVFGSLPHRWNAERCDAKLGKEAHRFLDALHQETGFLFVQ